MLVALAVLAGASSAPAHGTFRERYVYAQAQLAAHPADSEAHARIARLYAERGDFDDALATVDRAAELTGGFAAADLLRGDFLAQAGRLGEARTSLDRFLEREPAHGHGHLLRARVRAALGERDGALEDFRAALNGTRDAEPDLFQEVADALAAAGLADEAVATLERGCRARGRIPSFVLRAIEIESAAGRTDAALARIEAECAASRRPEPWMLRRAELLARAGREAEADAAYRELLARWTTLPPAERGSHSLTVIADRARRALVAANATGLSSRPPFSPPE